MSYIVCRESEKLKVKSAKPQCKIQKEKDERRDKTSKIQFYSAKQLRYVVRESQVTSRDAAARMNPVALLSSAFGVSTNSVKVATTESH